MIARMLENEIDPPTQAWLRAAHTHGGRSFEGADIITQLRFDSATAERVLQGLIDANFAHKDDAGLMCLTADGTELAIALSKETKG